MTTVGMERLLPLLFRETARLPCDREQRCGPEPGGEREDAEGDGLIAERCRAHGTPEDAHDLEVNILWPQLAVAIGIRQDQQERRSGRADAEQQSAEYSPEHGS